MQGERRRCNLDTGLTSAESSGVGLVSVIRSGPDEATQRNHHGKGRERQRDDWQTSFGSDKLVGMIWCKADIFIDMWFANGSQVSIRNDG